MASSIVIEKYDPRWPEMYAEEKKRICAAIGEYLVGIEHIGSTSVPGLGAKPIIDILAGVTTLRQVENCIEPLKTIGYKYLPEYEQIIPERRYFLKSRGDTQTHHLHIFEATNWLHRHELVFRDYMRAHPEAARQYVELKKQLAAQYGPDRTGYTAAKTDFIRAIIAQARKETVTSDA
ncbi:MAG: GrpB family protein [Chloroflexi bacterium]|nr:GrpB family protein [Chloroflexota bacterium]